MYAVLDAAGIVLACGDTDSFAAPDGGRVVEAAEDVLAGLAAGQEAYYDGAQFLTRARTLSADETDFNDIRDRLQTALANWATLTAAQKDTLLRVCVRGLLRSLR